MARNTEAQSSGGRLNTFLMGCTLSGCEYGLWSDWGSAALPVTNVPGENIQLHANVDNEVSLVWSTSGKYDFYIVERDGVAISRLREI